MSGIVLNALHLLPHLILTTTLIGIFPCLISKKETDLWISKMTCLESHNWKLPRSVCSRARILTTVPEGPPENLGSEWNQHYVKSGYENMNTITGKAGSDHIPWSPIHHHSLLPPSKINNNNTTQLRLQQRQSLAMSQQPLALPPLYLNPNLFSHFTKLWTSGET